MEGYKTIITSLLTIAFGLLGQFGVVIPPEAIAEFSGAIIALVGAVFMVLRLVTDGPVGDAIQRLLGK